MSALLKWDERFNTGGGCTAIACHIEHLDLYEGGRPDDYVTIMITDVDGPSAPDAGERCVMCVYINEEEWSDGGFVEVNYYENSDSAKEAAAAMLGDIEAQVKALYTTAAPEASREELIAALRAIVKITDGSQPIDHIGACIIAKAILARERA